MKTKSSQTKRMILLLVCSLVTLFANNSTVYAVEGFKLKQSKSIKVMKFSKNLKVRGFQISEGVYFGQAKVAGKYGLGFVVDKKVYSWGVNNRGISIAKRF
jgi:hypothetical protein